MGEVGATSWALSRRNSLPPIALLPPVHLLISVQPHPGFEPNGKNGLSSALFDNFPKPRHVFHNKVNGQCLNQMVDIVYEPILPKSFDAVINHLRYNFFVDEPLNKAVSLSKVGQPHPELEDFSINVLTQGMSFMGVDKISGKVAGVALNGVEAGLPPKKEYKDQKLRKIFDFILAMDKDVDVLRKYNQEDILELKILSVDSTFRRRGIAQTLCKITEKFARSKNFVLLRTDATALYSQKVFLNNGFKALKEVFYDEYPSRENPLFNVDPPNLSYKLLVKDISNK